MEEICPKKDLFSTLGGGLFMANLNDVCGHYEIKSPIYKNFIEKSKWICTNGMPKNGLIYVCTHMLVIKNCDHMTTMDENMNWMELS